MTRAPRDERCHRRGRICAAAVLVLAVVAVGRAQEEGAGSQLDTVRSRIRQLEGRLGELDQAATDAEQERNRLNALLQLAEARVEELELVLTATRDEAVRLRDEAAALSTELARRREVMVHHLEMMALLGQPGPLQLLFDAANGGDLERAIGTVSVLSQGQLRLMEEYTELQRERRGRLGALSRVLATAQREAEQLLDRRGELEQVRRRVDQRLRQLRRSRSSAEAELEELREREQALARLLEILSSRQRLQEAEDIRSFRGALPWPVRGEITRTFGRHYLPKYATYTVCNGLRMNTEPGAEVTAIFSGEVAYATDFKGYGKMVVLDHGNDVYSLVAGLDTIHVRLNQRVSMGMRLGLAAEPSEEGNLYLEIRVGNMPQDPRRWLQLEEGRS